MHGSYWFIMFPDHPWFSFKWIITSLRVLEQLPEALSHFSFLEVFFGILKFLVDKGSETTCDLRLHALPHMVHMVNQTLPEGWKLLGSKF